MAVMSDASGQSSLFAEVETIAGILTAKLIGPTLGQREVPIITEIVGGKIDSAGGSLRWVVLDLSEIGFMNSMALGMCVDFHKRAAAAGAKTAIVGMNDDITSLFKMVRFDRLFTIARSPRELAKALQA
jgi:anti-anti-sigma factor